MHIDSLTMKLPTIATQAEEDFPDMVWSGQAIYVSYLLLFSVAVK